MNSLRTVLYDVHRNAGAKLVDFAGFEMPLQYRGVLEEHRNVRNRVGLFDVSHMGEIEIRGSGALDLVQNMTTNDAGRLEPGRVQYSAMCDENGGIIDDLLVYHMGDHYMLVVNAANIAGDCAWLDDHRRNDVTLRNVSDETGLLALQGPRAASVLQQLTKTDLSSIQYYRFVRGDVAGIDLVISRTGYTGEIGYELYFEARKELAEKLWNALMKAGSDFGIMPAGLGARDTLRLEMGYCLYGNDIDRSTTPLEAGLGWITKLGKGEFVGRDALLGSRQANHGRKLVGFVLEEKAFPRKGYEIMSGGQTVGVVTSGTFSPTLEQGIGMGYISVPLTSPGSGVDIMIRGKTVHATVVALPFVRKGSD